MSEDEFEEFPQLMDTLDVESINCEIKNILVQEVGELQANLDIAKYICPNTGKDPVYSIFNIGNKIHTFVKKTDNSDISDFLHDCLEFELNVTIPEQMQNDGSLVLYEDLKSCGFSDSAIRYANGLDMMKLKFNSTLKPFLETCGKLEQYLFDNDINYCPNSFAVAQDYIFSKISPNYTSSSTDLFLTNNDDMFSKQIDPDERQADIVYQMKLDEEKLNNLKPKEIIYNDLHPRLDEDLSSRFFTPTERTNLIKLEMAELKKYN